MLKRNLLTSNEDVSFINSKDKKSKALRKKVHLNATLENENTFKNYLIFDEYITPEPATMINVYNCPVSNQEELLGCQIRQDSLSKSQSDQ